MAAGEEIYLMAWCSIIWRFFLQSSEGVCTATRVVRSLKTTSLIVGAISISFSRSIWTSRCIVLTCTSNTYTCCPYWFFSIRHVLASRDRSKHHGHIQNWRSPYHRRWFWSTFSDAEQLAWVKDLQFFAIMDKTVLYPPLACVAFCCGQKAAWSHAELEYPIFLYLLQTREVISLAD